jgi:hypothetical protein
MKYFKKYILITLMFVFCLLLLFILFYSYNAVDKNTITKKNICNDKSNLTYAYYNYTTNEITYTNSSHVICNNK